MDHFFRAKKSKLFNPMPQAPIRIGRPAVMPTFTSLRCSGGDCSRRTECVRFLCPEVRDSIQRVMHKPDGECDKFWQAKPEEITDKPTNLFGPRPDLEFF